MIKHNVFIYFWIEKFLLKIEIKSVFIFINTYEVMKALWLNVISMIPKYWYLVWHDAFEEVSMPKGGLKSESRSGENYPELLQW